MLPPIDVISRQSTDTLAIPNQTLVKALSFIRKNPAAQIQVDDVAAHAAVSRRVLERNFVRFLGRSPAMEIRRIHLERAKQLLSESNMPIPEVSEAAGFGSPEYMAYVFKEFLKKTPSQYRKIARTNNDVS